MGGIVLCALLSAVYPTLIAATTVMLLLPNADRLMFGFWLGAMITSVSCGLVVIFALSGSSAVATSKQSISPAIDLVFAVLLLIAAIALHRGGGEHVHRPHSRRAKADGAKVPRWRQTLGKGSPRHTFVVGILLSFPGIWYLAGLDRLIRQHYSTLAEIVVVVGFCLVQLILIEIPMLAFRVWPTETPIAIDKTKAWSSRHGRRIGVWTLVIVAGLLFLRGLIGLLA
jgi:hypothetical protein